MPRRTPTISRSPCSPARAARSPPARTSARCARNLSPPGERTAGVAEGHGFVGLLAAVTTFPKPLLAAVNGVGVGLGLTLLPHCDIVLIADGGAAQGALRQPRRRAGSRRQLHAAGDDGLAGGGVRVLHHRLDRRPDQRSRPASRCAASRTAGSSRRPWTWPGGSRRCRSVRWSRPSSSCSPTNLDLVRAARAREDEVFSRLTGAADNRGHRRPRQLPAGPLSARAVTTIADLARRPAR